jgi:hypothetical protein
MAPYKCPDCGHEHRCDLGSGVGWVRWQLTPGWPSLVCLCPPERVGGRLGGCPVHDISVTYCDGVRPAPIEVL